MRFALLVLIAGLFASSAARADEPCLAAHCDGKLFHFHAPGPVAIGIHVAAMSIIALDISTSLDIKNHQHEIAWDGSRYSQTESNPILGRHPSDTTFLLYGASVMALHTALWYVAPEEIRPFLDLAVVMVEIPFVTGNIGAGMGLKLPF